MRGLLAVWLLLPGIAHAQIPSANAAALGMADNFTALARGYAAVAWNPAALGWADNPRVSLALLPLRAIAGLDPITLGDIADYEGAFIPETVREQWLRQISAEGSEQGTGGGDLTWFAVQYGRFAAQLSSSMRALSNIAPDAAELILFGNYGRQGVPRALALSESHMSAFAASTFAVSYGMPVGASTASSQTTVGATVKLTMGHGLLHGEDRGTTFSEAASANVDFPVVGSRTDGFDANGGIGLGLDLGAALLRGPWTFAVAVQNLVNTFGWDEDDLVFRAGLATFDIDTHTTDFEEQAFASAPAHLRDFIDQARFPPMLSAGLSYVLHAKLTLSGDFRARLGDSTLEFTPDTHVGAGAEYLPWTMLPLRLGIAYVEGGYQVAGGSGVNFGPINLAVSLARRDTDLGVDTITMFTLISTTPR